MQITSDTSYRIIAIKNEINFSGGSDYDLRIKYKSNTQCKWYSMKSVPIEWLAIGY